MGLWRITPLHRSGERFTGERRREAGLLIAVRLGLLLGLLFCVSGCAHLNREYVAKPSRALAAPEETTLGQRAQALSKPHGDQSGFLILDSNVDAFLARAQMIEAAEKTLDVQSYLIWTDRTGRLLVKRILDAADRGVRVRILVDDVTVLWQGSTITRLDGHPNIELRVFNPFLGTRTSWILVLWDFLHAGRLTRRMHNKLFTADNAVAIVGGRNIADEYFAAKPEVNFEDLDVLVVGPAVQKLSLTFDEYWNYEWSYPVEAFRSQRYIARQLEKIRRITETADTDGAQSELAETLHESELLSRLMAEEIPLDWAKARVVYDRPSKISGDGDIYVSPQVWALAEQVQDELIVISPYFVPGEEGMELFRELRRRGVRVRILTNSLGSTDVVAAHTGYARYRWALLQEGIELYELRHTAMSRLKDARWLRRGLSRPSTTLHAKAYVFDRQKVVVGSMNLDNRAHYLNTELGLVIESPEVADKIARLFEESIQPRNSYRLGLEKFERVSSPRQGVPMRNEWPVWVTEERGRTVRFSHEPHAGLCRQFLSSLLMLLPLEGQL